MAYSYGHRHRLSATWVPGMDDYNPPPGPVLVAPEPQRINPEMSNQIADGIAAVNNLDLNAQAPRGAQNTERKSSLDEPNFSPFPKLVNPPPNVPPSDDELEATLENARQIVLSSNDPEMQLAWAADSLVYVGVCADNEERIAAAKPHTARPATPQIEHTLKMDAMNIVNFLADQHHPKAEFLKGMWLEWGRFGQREDKKEAFRCYSRAADKGYARAEYRIGMLYESYNDPIKALRHYHKGVDAGDAASCYRLGMMTLRGQHGQQQDYAKAIDLIRRSAIAADENAAQGAYVYGMLLAKQLPQIEVPDQYLQHDEVQARINIEKAAYLKFAKAQLKMGSSYELAALGCDFNPALSMHYNALASKQGEAEADMALSKWFLVGSEGLFPKNEELAYTYAERAAQSGLATAEFALGYFSEIGVYVRVDLDRAMEWYQKASKHGNEDAKGRIESLTKKQVLSRQDHENIAVSRIKSQHGSMRGGRPDRFRQQAVPRLDEVPESPSSVYSNGSTPVQGVSGWQAQSQAPLRGTTPYPITPIAPTSNDRPGSVAPYPLEDGPPQRLDPYLGVNAPQRPSTTLNPAVRPSSAFQWVPPEPRPNSVAAEPQQQVPYPGGPPQYGGPPNLMQNARPPTVQPYDPRARPPVGSRIASGPAAVQQNPYALNSYPPQQQIPPLQTSSQGPPMSQSRPPPGPAQTSPISAPPIQQTQLPGQKLDIGFSAPFENRQRQYGPSGRPSLDRPPVANPSAPGRSSLDRPPASNTPSSAPAPRPNTAQQPPSTRPNPAPTSKPPPGQATNPRLYNVGISKPVSPEALAAARPKPQPVAPAAAAPAPSKAGKKPAKGPKTFDEMGVPASKKRDDCVVM